MGGSTTIATSETRIEALKFQSSAYGVVLPVVYGVTRIPGNLMWYGGFKAIPHTTTQSQGGKGGSVKTQQTTYTYTAAVMMGLCEGDIAGVAQVWRGKTLYQGGNAPSQILTASQNYTVPVGGGSVTVTNASAYAADVSVISPSGGGESGNDSFQLSEGYHYTRVGGTYTFPSSAGGWGLEGLTLAITYQYTQAGASQTSLQQLGLSLAKGTVGQSVWSYLTTNFSSQAIGYSGIAYVYSSAYDLGTSASIDNHNFEVQAQMAYTISSSVPDADPSQVGYDITTNYRYGVAGFPATKLGTTGQWSNYCRAAGLLMSPAFTEQDSAAAVLKKLTDLTNTALVWSEGVLKFVPYGDTTITGNGATYTPNTTPLYDLTDDHFLDKDIPVRMKRKPQSDAYNQIQIEFLNRANQYNVEITEAKDQANIDTYGLRSPDVLKAHWICDATVARTVAQLMLQRALYIRNTYEFKLPWNFVLLEPMDLVTLTDATLGLSKTPVRITEVTESEDGELMFTAEDFPQGSATATLYPTQSGSGFSHNYNVTPGSANAPFIFEGPGALTQNGLEIYVAATGPNVNWGGCHVWVSLDGSNYKQVGTINGGSRYGVLASAATASGSLDVQLNTGVLGSGSSADAIALNTLCYIGGTAKEFFAYQTAVLTATQRYTLGGTLTRGAYGTTASAHSVNDPFVRVDEAIARSGPIDLSYVGKTIHIKLTSFNVYGGGEESLASVTDYTYTVSGSQIYGNAGASALQSLGNISSDAVLSAVEKSSVIQDYAVITTEQAGLDAQATVFGITSEKTAYDNAVSALTTYLNTLTTPVAWNVIPGDTSVVGSTFRQKFADVYATKQTLVNRIDSISSTLSSWTGTSGRPSNLAALVGSEAINNALVGSNLLWKVNAASAGPGIYGTTLDLMRWGGADSDAYGFKPGETLTISADLWCDAACLAAGQNVTIFLWTQRSDSQWTNSATATVSSSTPARVSGTITLPATLADMWGIGVGIYHQGTNAGPSPTGTVYCDRVQVERGPVATQYKPGAQPGATLGAIWGQNVQGSSTVDAAITTAQNTANTANTALANIASDSILSPSEKPAVVQDYAVIITEQAGVDAQATAYGITTEKTTYDNAVSALTSYLGGLSGWNTIPGSDVAIVGSTFRANFAAVYTAKQALLNKVAQVAGTTAVWSSVTGSGKPINNAGQIVDAGGGSSLFGQRERNDPPLDYPIGLTMQFKTMSALGLTATGNGYCTLETNKGYGDNSGVYVVQYAYDNSGTAYKRWGTATGTSWAGAWTLDLDRNNYTGDLNATNGAPAGTSVGGVAATTVAGAVTAYNGQVVNLTLGGSQTTFYPVAISSNVIGAATYYDVIVSRPSVHTDGTWLGSYTCHILARASAYGNAPAALIEVVQATGGGTYTSGVSNVYAGTGDQKIIVMMRGGMTHTISMSQPIGAYTVTPYLGGYTDGAIGTINPETTGTLLNFLNVAYRPSAPVPTVSIVDAAINQTYSLYDASGVGRSNAA